MAAGWPATAVVLLACAAPLLLWPAGARADSDVLLRHQHHQQHWCAKKECVCTDDYERQQQVTVKCTFSGEQVRRNENYVNMTYRHNIHGRNIVSERLRRGVHPLICDAHSRTITNFKRKFVNFSILNIMIHIDSEPDIRSKLR